MIPTFRMYCAPPDMSHITGEANLPVHWNLFRIPVIAIKAPSVDCQVLSLLWQIWISIDKYGTDEKAVGNGFVCQR